MAENKTVTFLCTTATHYRSMKLLTQYIKRSHDFLWSADIGASPALRRRLVLTLRTVCAVGRDPGEGRLTLRAMSLHSL